MRRKVLLEFNCPDEGWVQRTFTYPAHWEWSLVQSRASAAIEAGKRELGATEGRIVRKRVCCFCQSEHPQRAVQGVDVTHGICKRHFIESLKHAGLTEQCINEALEKRTTDWSPDMSFWEEKKEGA